MTNKKKEVRFLLVFAEILTRLYKTNPSDTIKECLLDTYKLIKKTKLYKGEAYSLDEIDL